MKFQYLLINAKVRLRTFVNWRSQPQIHKPKQYDDKYSQVIQSVASHQLRICIHLFVFLLRFFVRSQMSLKYKS
ncbi:hypothetical protein [Calothrix sp. NIES-2098]|uniref:hypothetical protein n=1 Tax=Calothrix sp. NIES-2098 TaxID=1954171 RepID=UPI0030DB4EA6